MNQPRKKVDSSMAGKWDWIDADTYRVGDKVISITVGRHLECAHCGGLIESMGQVYRHKLYHIKCYKIVRGKVK